MNKKNKFKTLRKLSALDIYVICSIISLIIYTIISQIIAIRNGIILDTLTTCFFGFFGGEIVTCGLIKIFKLHDFKGKTDIELTNNIEIILLVKGDFMEILNWMIENWYILVVIGVALVMIYIAITDKKKVLEWLRYAVTMAEQELGGGTGQIKLRQVYDMFIERFPIFSKLVPFSVFSSWVDIALEFLKEQIEKNQKIKDFVGV